MEVAHGDLIRGDVDAFRRELMGRRLDRVLRRGKNVVLALDPEAFLVVNLGMTGRLVPRRPSAHGDEPTHPGVIFRLQDGHRLVYHDPRRFGSLELHDPASFRVWSERLGPEPLDRAFTARRLADLLSRSRAPIRSWLLDQRRVAGVGNIYANEALHRAGIHPRRPAGELTMEETKALHRGLRAILRSAVAEGGTTLRDFRDPAGKEGRFRDALRVYGREGRPCPRCGAQVRREVFGGRSAFLCPGCQPPPRAPGFTPR